MNRLTTLATLSLVGLVGLPAIAGTREERVDRVSSMLAGAASASDDKNTQYVDAKTGETITATPRQLMRETLTEVDFDEMPARMALEIWSNQTGVPLVVNWKALEAVGIDSTTPITLKLNRVPAEQVLKLLVQQMHPDPIGDDALLLNIEQWYVRIITREQALRQSTTRMYFIGDLLMDIPNFDNAPGFDLNDALSNTNTGGSNQSGGGGGGGGEGGLFGDDDNDEQKERSLSKEEKAEQICDVIRNTIEPRIWRENGGEYASVRYFRGMLVVKAPDFVHEQIGGIPSGGNSARSTTRRSSGNSSSNSDAGGNSSTNRPARSTSGNVSGTAPSGPKLVR